MDELWRRGAGELAAMIRGGETTSAEVVDAHLDRIDEVNGPLNAIVHVMADDARAEAAAVDDAVASGVDIGPLAGVPFTIKENIDVAGLPTTLGIAALADARAPVDAPVVERMKAAGAVPLARTNLPDLGLRIHTDSELHGLTCNPWHPGRTAGGSSGGEAAALATGMSPIGLGNDLGGSLRNPASCCSIASIKPTTGRVPAAFTFPAPDASITEQLFAVEGPMARTVADVRLGLSILAGWHVRDPHSVPMPLDGPPPGVRRVAVMAAPPAGDTDPRVAEATRRAARALEDAGCHVDEVEAPRYDEVVEVWSGLVLGGIHLALPLLEPVLSDASVEFLRLSEGIVEPPTLESMGLLWMRRQSLMRAWAEFFTDWEVLLTPTWTHLPFEHGTDAVSAEAALATLNQARPVMPGNALGLPSAAVPAAVVDGLPVGVLVNGPAWSELVCLEVAELIESAGLVAPTPIEPVTA